MSNTYLDKAIEAVPRFAERISLFTKKLRLAQYADSTIYSYRLKISQAVLYLGKLPDKFTQTDVDDYLTMLLDRNCYSLSFFKHTVFGLKDYYKYMGLKEPGGLVLPRVRKPKRLPRVLSQEQMKRLIGLCDLYDKALLSTIYDCALRVSEACSLKWIDISCLQSSTWKSAPPHTIRIPSYLFEGGQWHLPEFSAFFLSYGNIQLLSLNVGSVLHGVLSIAPLLWPLLTSHGSLLLLCFQSVLSTRIDRENSSDKGNVFPPYTYFIHTGCSE